LPLNEERMSIPSEEAAFVVEWKPRVLHNSPDDDDDDITFDTLGLMVCAAIDRETNAHEDGRMQKESKGLI